MIKSLDEKSGNLASLLLVVVVTVALLVGGFALLSSGALAGVFKKDKQSAPAAPSNYAAVFLSNNQVYFGKLKDAESSFPTLTDVFYLRVTQSLAPGTAGAAENVTVKSARDKTATPAASLARPKNELTLIKLGAEIHGPTDAIRINRDHIVFVETLKDDSKVVKAIADFRAKNP